MAGAAGAAGAFFFLSSLLFYSYPIICGFGITQVLTNIVHLIKYFIAETHAFILHILTSTAQTIQILGNIVLKLKKKDI